MNNLIKYTPLLEIETYDNQKYYIEKSKESKLLQLINDNKFINIGDYTIATNNIKLIGPARQENNFIESELSKFDFETRLKLRQEIKKRKSEFEFKELTQKTLQNIIEKFNT